MNGTMRGAFNRLAKQLTPEQICRASLLAMRVPAEIVQRLKVGRELDWWVHFAVMHQPPFRWEQAELLVAEAMKREAAG